MAKNEQHYLPITRKVRPLSDSKSLHGGNEGHSFLPRYGKKGKSAAQNIEKICFDPSGPLRTTFGLLFSSLFKHGEKHEQLIGQRGGQKPILVFYKTTKPNKILNSPDKRGGRSQRPPRYVWLSKYYLVILSLFFRNLAFETTPCFIPLASTPLYLYRALGGPEPSGKRRCRRASSGFAVGVGCRLPVRSAPLGQRH